MILIVALLCFSNESCGDAFVIRNPAALTTRHDLPAVVSTLRLAGANSGEEDEPQQQPHLDDKASLQRELDEMMQAKGTAAQKEEDEMMNVYNAAPLFTGGIITVLSLLGTGYMVR